MDNAQKAIMIGVGLFVTILIIAAVMLIVNPAINLLDIGAGKVIQMSETVQKMLYERYDDTTVYGAEVVSAAQQFSSEQTMVIEVMPIIGGNLLELGKVRGNGTTTLDKALKYDSTNVQSKVSALSDSSNMDTYVPASARFNAQLIKSTSGDTVMGILFTRIK